VDGYLQYWSLRPAAAASPSNDDDDDDDACNYSFSTEVSAHDAG